MVALTLGRGLTVCLFAGWQEWYFPSHRHQGSVVLRPHGSYRIEPYGRVVFARAFGSWNVQTVEEYFSELRPLCRAMAGSQWAIVADLSQWEFGTPEIVKPFNDFEPILDASGRSHTAIITGIIPDLQEIWIRAGFRSQTAAPLRFFDGEDAALTWLAGFGLFPSPARMPNESGDA